MSKRLAPAVTDLPETSASRSMSQVFSAATVGLARSCRTARRLGALAADFRLDPIFLLTNGTLKILALMRTARTTDFRSVAVPPIMYGTAWKEDRTQALTLEAIATGFRAFDTANQRKHYVEEGVGAAVTAAIASGIVKREEFFLQTKFTYQRG